MRLIETREDIPLFLLLMGYKNICEVGVRAGVFLYHLAKCKPNHVVGVDIWDKCDRYDGWYNDTFWSRSRTRSYKNIVKKWARKQHFNVDIIVGYSVEASKTFKDGYFDFVYIDASHDYESVLDDLNAWYPKIRKGGCISGHDYLDPGFVFPWPCGVLPAVHDFVENNDIDMFYVTNEPPNVERSFLIIK
jgi:hypothetical protein